MAHDPIIRSLLEIDCYKLPMGDHMFRRFPQARMQYAFKNRTTSVRLADLIPVEQVREELSHVRTLRLQPAEKEYLETCPHLQHLSKPYIQALSELQLPEVNVEVIDGQFDIRTAYDECWKVSPWETLKMSIVTELYHRALLARDGITGDADREAAFWAAGGERLREKLSRLAKLEGAVVSEAGNRRRASGKWHEVVVNEFIDLAPAQFAGTSNVWLAMKYGVPPRGTLAHEMDMLYAGIYGETDEGLRDSHGLMIRNWLEDFGPEHCLPRTDTYGSSFFFRNLVEKGLAEQLVWSSHDSGDPFPYGERLIAFYQGLGIDPATKGTCFCDGNKIDSIERLHAQFHGRMKLAYLWGTNLTNDLDQQTLSLVAKPCLVEGREVGKTTDNIAKGCGSPAVLERLVRVFQCAPIEDTECEY